MADRLPQIRTDQPEWEGHPEYTGPPSSGVAVTRTATLRDTKGREVYELSLDEDGNLIVAYDEERWLDDARVDEAAGIGTMAEVEEMLIEAAWELAEAA